MKKRKLLNCLLGLAMAAASHSVRADDPVKSPSDAQPPAATMAESTADEGVCADEACYSCSPLLGLLGPLGNWIAPSDTTFCDFISPMTNPVYFEDPRTLTEARFIYIDQQLPTLLGVPGEKVRLVAMQARAAVTDRLSIVAAKDGYIFTDSPIVPDDGFADVSVGLKYNLLVDPCARRLVSAGVSYDMPIGSTDALQGNGDGEFHVYVTGLAQVGCFHWVSGTGFRLPTNTTDESQSWYWSNHLDKQLGCSSNYSFVEVNWYHWLRSGQDGPPGIDGGDLFNLGGVGVAGNDIVTGAFGVKRKFGCMNELGLAWEVPLTERRDVLENRLTVDLILRY